MVQLVGFNGPTPYSIIVWQRDGVDQAKTICYTEKEEEKAMNRFYTPNDFYHTYDRAVIYKDDEITTFTKAKGA